MNNRLCSLLFLIHSLVFRIEHSFSIWLLTGFLLIVFTLCETLLAWFTDLLGLQSPVATLFLFATFFFMILSIHFSIRLTDHTAHLIKLSQEMSLLTAELEAEKQRKGADGTKLPQNAATKVAGHGSAVQA